MEHTLVRYCRILTLLFTIQLFFFISVFAQGDFKLLGTIDKKYDGGYVKLGGNGIKYLSIKSDIKNGQFYFFDKIEKEYEPVWIEVWRDGKSAAVGFYIFAGKMRINIRNIDKDSKKNDIDFVNIPFMDIQNEYENLTKHTDSIYSNSNHFFDSVRNVNAGNIPDSLQNLLSYLRQNKLNAKIDFIKKHIDSYYALNTFFYYVVNSPYIDSDSFRVVFSLFSNKLKHTVIGKQIDSVINKKITLPLNNKLPGISFKTDSGKLYSISDYVGQQYVLVCFWASWCVPCIKNIPLLKKLDDTYRSKGLQLISISIDEEEGKWASALKRNPMPWLQTCTLSKYITDQTIMKSFSVNAVPQYFLIDKTGKVIYNNFQSKDSDSYAELQHILKTKLN